MLPHISTRVRVAVLLALLLVLGGLLAYNLSSGTGEPPTVAAADPVWGNYISAHTSGVISKKAKLRVVFVNDVVGKDQVGASAASVLKVSPGVDGTPTFASEREVVLVPGEDLRPGQFYTLSIKPKGLNGIPETLGRYEFVVQVMPPELQLDLAGLAADPMNDARMVLRGTLLTADVEPADRIEKLLAATYLDKALGLEWRHDGDGRRHDFTLSGIERQAENQPLRVSWNGAAIGASSTGERVVEVPAKDAFKVTRVEVVQDGRQSVRVYFSDNIDPQQNLRGLIRLSQGGYSSHVEGNTVKIYPDQGLQGSVVVTLEPGIRNAKGGRLQNQVQETVVFVSEKPQVRFVGKGVVLPENDVLSIPFEAVNVRSVRVTAFRIYENNVGQFLQTNKLDGASELNRVGRYLWRKTIRLSSPEANKWNRYSLDATKLLRENPGGLFRLTIAITPADSLYHCPGREPVAADLEAPVKSDDDLSLKEASSWDYAEDYYGENDDGSSWRDREDPCKNAYYRFGNNVKHERNFLASNIGLLAKRDQHGRLLIVATDLRTSKPLKGVELAVMNFQDQRMASVETDGSGFATIETKGAPFYLIADYDGQKGYLKLSSGAALTTSHLDVGGEKVADGIKGLLYGERGVWRPGDDVYLTFVLQDKDERLPATHPVTLELFNPKGQLAQTVTNGTPVGRFYKFALKTAPDAPTGNWIAKAHVGGSTFTKTLKIETVMPNRLKIELDFGKEPLREAQLKGRLFAQWLSGATAGGLNADVKVRLMPVATRFDRYADFTFDDPAREFKGEPETIFEGSLDGEGRAAFDAGLASDKQAPGMLSATFISRVFERGGAFSTNVKTAKYSPYEHYVGIKLPKGDQARNMLLTDTAHTVEIASVDADGRPVSLKNVKVTLYKIDWRWWWDKSGESLAQFANAAHSSVVQQSDTRTSNGQGAWKFEIKYPSWGRYLVRACDSDGAHCAGKVFYIDWPGWAGRAQEQGGPGANVLTFFADKAEYKVGETAKVQLPEATQGRALVTVENGSRILDARWIELKGGKTLFEVPITPAMSPNVYVSVTLIQPHADKKNDRPIRLYGVIPLKVNDPKTHLQPTLEAPAEWAPEADAVIEVAEAGGREMTYTVAIVDEGLLGLTSFQTPNLHEHFYRREALGVTTWDLFDDVVGAYGGELERLLALGGSDGADATEGRKEDKKRFPPVVRYLGPFKLKAGASNRHAFKLPQYVGAVRVMVVAGHKAAYGSTEKSVFVRQPLMLLPTLPRVIGPDEELTVPVSLFVMDKAIKQVTLKVQPDRHFQAIGSDTVNVTFTRPDEKLGFVKLKTQSGVGKGAVSCIATSGAHQAKATVYLDIRSPNPPVARHATKALAPGETWEQAVVPHGVAGTNVVTLEVSAVPPLNLEQRLNFLIQYPHGCLEQTTSSVFPQLYLPALVKLEEAKKQEIERNVRAGIERLRRYQVANGGFVYWPGGFVSASVFDTRNAWSTNYAGHFLVEAEKLGYAVPSDMMAAWLQYQKSAAQSWAAHHNTPPLDQAYRLYTLALAGQPEIGAMNRLRESRDLPSVARWQLAAAYRLAGMPDAANDVVRNDRPALQDYTQPDDTFGSRLRDSAIVLNGMLALGRLDEAKALANEVSAELSSQKWHSTQSVAYALNAMSKFVGAGSAVSGFAFERQVVGGQRETIKSGAPIHTAELKAFPPAGAPVKVKNKSDRTLFASIVVRGVPKAGEESASSSGLGIDVRYTDADGGEIDVSRLRQGQDLVAHVSVSNHTQADIANIALSQILPSGWEIHNARMQGEGAKEASAAEYEDIRDDRVYRYFKLRAGETKRFATALNAAYLGRYYLPSVSVEAMYDATKEARTRGQWVEVVTSGE